MRCLVFLAALIGIGQVAQADISVKESAPITVPSGQPVQFFESLFDRPAMGLTARFRFVAPDLPQKIADLSYERLEVDMAYLCDTYALPRLVGVVPATIVISLSERATEFASSEPDVAQVFEAYRPAGETCEWEAF